MPPLKSRVLILIVTNLWFTLAVHAYLFHRTSTERIAAELTCCHCCRQPGYQLVSGNLPILMQLPFMQERARALSLGLPPLSLITAALWSPEFKLKRTVNNHPIDLSWIVPKTLRNIRILTCMQLNRVRLYQCSWWPEAINMFSSRIRLEKRENACCVPEYHLDYYSQMILTDIEDGAKFGRCRRRKTCAPSLHESCSRLVAPRTT